MKYFALAACVVFTISGNAQSQEKTVQKYSSLITHEGLKKQLLIVAGPEMEGRETATEGQRKAAAYIENEMKSIGLKPGNGSQYQLTFPLFKDSLLSSSLTVNGSPLGINKQFSVTTGNYTSHLAFSEVTFIDFDDTLWKGDKMDIAGKLVMFYGDSTRRRRGTTAVTTQIANVMKKGAGAALVIAKKSTLDKPDVVSKLRLKKYPVSQEINYYTITPETAEMLMDKNVAIPDSLGRKIYKQEIILDYAESLLATQSTNVLGILEGTEKKDEYLAVTAHYDHLGKKDTLIYYGADDDGSGTVTVLEMARAFAKAKADGHGPKRNILFMTVSGEEKGLLGSEYYTAQPVFPLDKTTANLNIDMIGRTDSAHIKSNQPDYVYLVGDHKLSSDLPGIAKAANKNFKLQLDAKFNDPNDKERIYTRSDHYNFAKKGVPVIFYYDGGHPDYHRPTDTVDRIQFDLMTKRARYIFTTAWEMANRNEMLKRDMPL